MPFLPSNPERREDPRAFAYECAVSAKRECPGALCLYEWGLHVLVRGHVRHVGWELYLKKVNWKKMKRYHANGINLPLGTPASLLPTTTEAHLFY